jgi:hypothetical protein
MQLYNVTWQFPEIEGQKAAYAKLIDYMASGAEADCFDGFELISRTHCPQTGSGVVICKARGTKELFKHFAPWRAMFGVEFDMHQPSAMKRCVNATRSCLSRWWADSFSSPGSGG